MRQGPSQPKRDAFRLWPTSVSLVFLLEFYCSNFLEATTGVLGLKLFFLNAIFLILWLIIAIILTCYSLFRKRWRLALSIIASPLVAYALILSLHWSGITPERLRLEWNKAKYLQEISQLPATDGQPRQMRWGWGGTGFVGSIQMEYALVYDESDQIAGFHSKEYFPNGNFFTVDIIRLSDHFYLQTTTFY